MQNPLEVNKKSSTFTKNYSGDFNELRQLGRNLQYSHRLSFYDEPPNIDISLENFALVAQDRLKVLKELENALLSNKTEQEMKDLLNCFQKKYLAWDSNHQLKQGVNVDSQREKDRISHYALRLAYCTTDDLKNWFLRYETLLFKLRWELLDRDEKTFFLDSTHILSNFSVLSDSEKSLLSDDLFSSSSSVLSKLLSNSSISLESFFKVPFEKAPDLISRRECYVSMGFAFVPQSLLISVILAEFKRQLSNSLVVSSRAVNSIGNGQMLSDILRNISRQNLDQEYQFNSSASLSNLSPSDIDSFAPLFPPCMRHLHNQLRRDKHLKHMGRMQYGLFLKGLGLSMENSLVFWRQSFSLMTDDKFQKGGYAYNIRHNYGKEGKRANYTPYGCMKIITSNPPSHGDHHGCPFKHFNQENLIKLLSEFGLDEDEKRQVGSLAKQGHCQLACTKYGEILREKKQEETSSIKTVEIEYETISHPNQFFDYAVQAAGMSAEGNADTLEALK